MLASLLLPPECLLSPHTSLSNSEQEEKSEGSSLPSPTDKRNISIEELRKEHQKFRVASSPVTLRDRPLLPRSRHAGPKEREETRPPSLQRVRGSRFSFNSSVQLVRAKRSRELEEVLREPILLAGFRAFLASNHCEEVLDFCREANYFQAVHVFLPLEESYQIGREIYSRFICVGAPQEVNIPERYRQPLDHIFSQRDPSEPSRFLPRNCFEAPQREILRLLSIDWFPLYKQSDQFAER